MRQPPCNFISKRRSECQNRRRQVSLLVEVVGVNPIYIGIVVVLAGSPIDLSIGIVFNPLEAKPHTLAGRIDAHDAQLQLFAFLDHFARMRDPVVGKL